MALSTESEAYIRGALGTMSGGSEWFIRIKLGLSE